MTTLVMVDDHALIRRSLISLLSTEPGLEVVADTGSAVDGARLVAHHQPDIAVLDVALRDGDGMELAAKIRHSSPATSVVFLTMHDDDATIRAAVRLSAAGMVGKLDDFEELIDILRSVPAGGRHYSSSIAPRVAALAAQVPPSAVDALLAQPLAAVVNDDMGTLLSPVARRELTQQARILSEQQRRRRKPFEQLSPREDQVLRALIDGNSAEAIAADFYVSIATVRSQIRSVLSKLGVNSQLAAVALARSAGWPQETSIDPTSGQKDRRSVVAG